MSTQQLNQANLTNSDDEAQEEAEKTSPETADEQGFLGKDPDPEVATEKDTLEVAQEMGLYSNSDEEHPAPLGEDNSILPD